MLLNLTVPYENENFDSGMSSLEGSPSETATSRFARKKWSSAFRVVQGLHRFRLPLHRREDYRRTVLSKQLGCSPRKLPAGMANK
ncbi:hypothetical protein TELCIR_02976 [Teladorsagia circumcincta]|uniref:Uncharacterized protein n=1 Tax=Teladorsagia circumcincta TaxID=45464 RepID=A0A2G9UXM9_TELCI|nr:hypothetical protein TELCIR_02976 [Teladorsagia circumcincta]